MFNLPRAIVKKTFSFRSPSVSVISPIDDDITGFCMSFGFSKSWRKSVRLDVSGFSIRFVGDLSPSDINSDFVRSSFLRVLCQESWLTLLSATTTRTTMTNIETILINSTILTFIWSTIYLTRLENLWFSDVFSGSKKKPVAWNRLTYLIHRITN